MSLMKPAKATRRAATPGAMLRSKIGERAHNGGLTPEWRAMSEWYADLAEERAGRAGIDVMAGPGMCPEAPGMYVFPLDRIVLEGAILPAAPGELDGADSDHFAALAALQGVFEHEVGHAIHTDPEALECEDGRVGQMMVVLEEIRMEAQTVRDRAANARWLRAAARHLLLDADRIAGAEGAGVAGMVQTAILTEGRVHAGSLKQADVQQITDMLDGLLDADVRRDLDAIMAEAVQIEDGDRQGMERLGRRLVNLIPEDEQGGGEGQGGNTGLQQAVKQAAGQASDDEATALETSADGGEIDQQIEDMQESMGGSAQDGDPSDGAGGASGRDLDGWSERMPSPGERAARRRLASLLRRFRWRERRMVARPSMLPPGRLRSRDALRADAERSMGRMQTAQPWRKKKRAYVDLPSVRMGIMVDTSGSMYGAIPMASSALWVLANAVSDAGGSMCATAFGDGLTEVIPVGKAPKRVPELPAWGGTENVAAGMDHMIEALGLDDPTRGPGLIVIVSDGYWAGSEGQMCEERMVWLRERNIETIQVGVGAEPMVHGAEFACVVNTVDDFVGEIGGRAAEALRRFA